MKTEYEYVSDLRPGESQYDGLYDLGMDSIVDARYVKSKIEPGNPFVEALPEAWTMETVTKNYNRAIDVPTPEELMEMDEYEREDSVDILLDDFRLQLPFHAIVEKEFHRALIRSYHRRLCRGE